METTCFQQPKKEIMNSKIQNNSKLVYGLVESLGSLYKAAQEKEIPDNQNESVIASRNGNKKPLWRAEGAWNGENDGPDILVFIRAETKEKAEKYFVDEFTNKGDGNGNGWDLVTLKETTEDFMNEVENEYSKTAFRGEHQHYTTKIEDLEDGMELPRFDQIYACDDNGTLIPDFGKGDGSDEDEDEPEIKREDLKKTIMDLDESYEDGRYTYLILNVPKAVNDKMFADDLLEGTLVGRSVVEDVEKVVGHLVNIIHHDQLHIIKFDDKNAAGAVAQRLYGKDFGYFIV